MLPITDLAMTRFNISLEDGVGMVLYAMEHAFGGELFVPKIPSYRITDLAYAIAPECEQEVVGIRPGEKVHDEMISISDSFTTYDIGKYFVILPQATNYKFEEFKMKYNAQKVPEGFFYNSGSNTEWINVEEIRYLIKKHVDPSFDETYTG